MIEKDEQVYIKTVFWGWKDSQGIGDDPGDYEPWLDCFCAGYMARKDEQLRISLAEEMQEARARDERSANAE